MAKTPPALGSYHFRRTKTEGLIEVLNDGYYVMAEYDERTGVVRWLRVALAGLKERIEKRLEETYPVRTKARSVAR